MHRDSGIPIRCCYAATEDGSDRHIQLRHGGGGAVRATVQRADGTMEVVQSLPGQVLDLWVPSGGFWAADGAGAGALEWLPWSHAVCTGTARTVVFFVDHGAALDQQAQQMATAVAYLTALGPCPRPAMLPTLETDIDWATTEKDTVDGIMISVNHYHKLVADGEIERQAGLTNDEMKSISARYIGSLLPNACSPQRTFTANLALASPHARGLLCATANRVEFLIQSNDNGDTKLWPAKKAIPHNWTIITDPMKHAVHAGIQRVMARATLARATPTPGPSHPNPNPNPEPPQPQA